MLCVANWTIAEKTLFYCARVAIETLFHTNEMCVAWFFIEAKQYAEFIPRYARSLWAAD